MTRFERLFVWTGGALFVLSLAACVYAYAVVWGTPPAEGGGLRAIALDAVLLSLFALHHSLFARESIKRRLGRVVPDKLLRSFYVWTASLLLIGALALWQRIGGTRYDVTGWGAVAFPAVQLTGLWLIVRSVAKIDALELAGIRPVLVRDALQAQGPYRWVRHPLYLGWVLALFGAAHMTADRFAFATITTAYLLVAIPWEERSLIRSFGDQYIRYQQQVRWRVFPYVY